MNSLTQYLDLYTAHRDLLDKGGAPVMNRLRGQAFESLENAVLPPRGSENYETIDLNQLLSPDFGINLARVNIDVNSRAPFHCGVPNLTPAIFFFNNDIYAEAKGASEALPEGIFVGSFHSFCSKFPELADKYYGKAADLSDPLTALNTLLAQDGIVVYVKDGVKFDNPIQIVGILENGAPLMAVRRMLIIVGKEASLKLLICEHTQSEKLKLMNLQVIEVFAGAHSNIEIVGMEESTEDTSRLSSLYLRQEANSEVAVTGVTLYNGTTRNQYLCKFEGPEASLRLSGMAIEDKERNIDTYSVVEHSYPGCHTDELFKYVVDDKACGTFSGLIKVLKGADKTEAYQSNRNLIGNDGARIYSKPSLEIYDDDVKCSHGSATGQLDPNQIFYMQTRGLSEGEARFLLKQAFMADVIDRVSMPDFSSRLQKLVEKRFSGASHGCSSCRSNCLNIED